MGAFGLPPGPATVVHPPETQQSSDPYFTDYVRRWLEANLPGGADQIFQGGLRIETTLDPDAQAAAREQVAAFLDGTEPDLRTSLVAVEPPTGYVRAFISGRDFVADQIAAYKYPRVIRLGPLPKGPTGKILKREIRIER